MVIFSLSICVKAEQPPYINWEERTIPNQYIKILFNGNDYWTSNYFGVNNPYTQIREIDISKIGEFIYQTEAIAGYDYFEYDTEITINCEIYSLKSISVNYAVAVKYDGYDGYFAFINQSYMPETLNDLINDLNLSKNSFAHDTLRNDLFLVRDNILSVRYALPDYSSLWELLLSNTTSKGSKYDKDYPRSGGIIYSSILDDVINKISYLRINIDGSLIITFPLGDSVMFSINEDTIQTFMEYVRMHGEEYEEDKEVSETEDENNNFSLWIVLIIVSVAIIITILIIRKIKSL